MPGTSAKRRTIGRYSAVLVTLVLSGCSILAPELEPEPVPEPVVIVKPAADEPVVADVPTPVKKPEPVKVPEPVRLPPVAIVMTNSQPAFLDVANALVGQLDDVQVFDLSDSSKPPVAVLRGINDSDSGTVVAIGLRAARSAVAMANSPVVFSQVFNHQDHGLLTANSRGVSALAPLDAQLKAWTESDPSISRVGIIIGEGHDALLDEAREAAEKHNVELTIQIANSDQETLYIFKRMAQDIDGFWLFPDNRILSARSLQQILNIAERGQIAVAVPNESMLAIGATISIESQAADIAATIARIVRKIHSDGLQSIPAISPLSAIRVVTRGDNKVVSR